MLKNEISHLVLLIILLKTSFLISQSINPNNIIIFKIDDSEQLENISSTYSQTFDQESINYCNFDPSSVTNKQSKSNENFKPADFNMNIFLKGDFYNQSSQITGKIKKS